MTHNRDCYNFLCSKNTDNNCNGERVNCQAHLYAEDAPIENPIAKYCTTEYLNVCVECRNIVERIGQDVAKNAFLVINESDNLGETILRITKRQ